MCFRDMAEELAFLYRYEGEFWCLMVVMFLIPVLNTCLEFNMTFFVVVWMAVFCQSGVCSETRQGARHRVRLPSMATRVEAVVRELMEV